ncbi:MAG: hypothetical protein FWH27_17535 [Planctomycetaceae bacterium]|nr:hypothetical protein [Planctomycetaceae bacterium]
MKQLGSVYSTAAKPENEMWFFQTEFRIGMAVDSTIVQSYFYNNSQKTACKDDFAHNFY